MIHEAIYNILKDVEANCYPGAVRQEDEPPFIVHRQLGLAPNPSKDIASHHDFIDYQVGYWAQTKDEAETLAGSGRTALDSYSGTLNDVTIINTRMNDQKGDFDDASQLYAVLQNYRIWIKL